MKKIIIFIILCGLPLYSTSQQLPQIIPTVPQPSTIPRMNHSTFGKQRTTVPVHGFQQEILAQNKQQLLQYERDRQAVLAAEKAKEQFLKEQREYSILYKLPNNKHVLKRQSYHRAFQALQAMNPDDFSIRKATFLIENAFYDEQKSEGDFNKTIANTVDFIQQIIKQQGVNPQDNTAQNLVLYQYFTDTLTSGEQTHYPYRYDFNDYMGQKNWDNMFVHKLMLEGSGQCNSMPRYYLILAEAMGIESHLAFAPNHSFIKFQNPTGDWYNAELTSGAIMTDAFMLSSGFIKSETVMNGNYLIPKTKRELMAQLLNDLASGYISKHGYDGFIDEVISRSLQLNPKGINGNIHKLHYQIEELEFIVRQLQIRRQEDLKYYPKAQKRFEAIQLQMKKLKALGHEVMPKERYEAWLKDLKAEAIKQEQNQVLQKLHSSPIIKD